MRRRSVRPWKKQIFWNGANDAGDIKNAPAHIGGGQ